MNYCLSDLKNISKAIRKKIFKMAYKAGGAHLGASFSIVEILTALYFGGVMKYDSNNPQMVDRDIMILSKGHAGAALYAVLAEAGYFNEELLYTFCQPGSILGGHPKMDEVPGVEASTGALGHGLLFGQGIALAGKLDNKDYKVFVILGDGECQEGTIWEAALFAPQQKLGNLTVIIDYNKLQAMDHLENIIDMNNMAEKWKQFGWNVSEVDGHDIKALVDELKIDNPKDGAPRIIIAHTIKGKGVSFMENVPIWHYRMPNDKEFPIALAELDIDKQELER
ncbi:MAG: transketolase [Bacillota bacterium]